MQKSNEELEEVDKYRHTHTNTLTPGHTHTLTQIHTHMYA